MARIHNHHGRPRDGFVFFKARLAFPGGESFQKISHVYISRQPAGWDQILKKEEDWIRLDLENEVKPLGGKWGQAHSVILGFREEELNNQAASDELKNHLVALERKQFPALEDEEFYLSDLIGVELRNGEGASVGVVQEVYGVSRETFNLVARNEAGDAIEFPTQWIDWSLSHVLPEEPEKSHICVPDIEEWSE